MERELTSYEKKEIRKLINICANFSRTNGCIPLECSCYMLEKTNTGAYCKWFVNAILPLHPKLEASLKGKTVESKPCGICGKHFPIAGRKQYCSLECAAIVRKNAGKSRARKHRQNNR